jgi:hypothetical protein
MRASRLATIALVVAVVIVAVLFYLLFLGNQTTIPLAGPPQSP